jgi:MFS family permease
MYHAARRTAPAVAVTVASLGTFGRRFGRERSGIWCLCFYACFKVSGWAGEWGGAVLMVVENAPTKSRGLLGSMVQLGYPIGNLAAIGALALLSQLPEADFLAWGWRIPFLISILLAGVGLYIRMQLEETPVFREIEAKKAMARLPLVEVLTEHRRSFFTAVGLKLSEISYVSIAGVFAISYVTSKLGMPRSVILNAILVSAVVALLAIPVFGWLSDRIGRKTMFYASCMFAIAFAFPIVFASEHEGFADHHVNDHRGHYLRANCGIQRRRTLVFRTFLGEIALQRRFARLPDRRGDKRWPHSFCGGDVYGLDWRRDLADFALFDRSGVNHLCCYDGCA